LKGRCWQLPAAYRTPPGAASSARKTCALKKNLAFLTVPLEFPEANADAEDSAMAIDLCRNVRTSALMLLSLVIFLR
jgi:hypothetical protein